MLERIKEIVEKNGQCYVALSTMFEISKKLKELRPQDWEEIERDLSDYTLVGAYDTEEEALDNLGCLINKFNWGGNSFIEWNTGRVVYVIQDTLDELEEEEDLVDLSMDGSDYVGINELKEFCKKW